jgi:hypothetical protein
MIKCFAVPSGTYGVLQLHPAIEVSFLRFPCWENDLSITAEASMDYINKTNLRIEQSILDTNAGKQWS